jgi:coenzyme F420-reducing hydrogenase alpha subunit
MKKKSKTIQLDVDLLARVEGEGGVLLRLVGNRVEQVELRVFEPPRLFEAFLRGRSRMEAPDLTSRICGICPVAYLLSACHAMEDAAGVRVDEGLRVLRRLLYCGEWIESHALHVFLLHAPDFFHCENTVELAKRHPGVVRTGLRMKKAGNAIVEQLGGRAIHPVNVRLGGFYRTPTRDELRALLPEIEWSLAAVPDILAWANALPFPDFEHDQEFVALRHPDEYPFCEGRIVSTRGLDIAVREYEDHVIEEQVPYSTAIRPRLRARGTYVCGPMARFNLCSDRLGDVARRAALDLGIAAPCRNPFKAILVRLVEIVHAFDEARRIILGYEPPERPFIDVPQRAGTGYGCTEAPRGSLYHRYTVDEQGTILAANLVPPTCPNLNAIEEDLRAMGPTLAALAARSRDEAVRRAEQTVRNYDPCISCSTHFVDLRVQPA